MLTKIIAEKCNQKKNELTKYLAQNYHISHVDEYYLQELIELVIDCTMASSEEGLMSLYSRRTRFPFELTNPIFDDSLDEKYVKLLADFTAYFYASYMFNYAIPILGEPVAKPIVGLDLASGLNFSSYFPKLSPLEKWYAVDNSFYVSAYLKTMKNIFSADSIEVLQDDVIELVNPTETLDVVRAKNLFNYVPSADQKLKEILNEWLRPGGTFLVPVDSYEDGFNYKQLLNFTENFGAEMRGYINNGWTLDYRKNTHEQWCAKYLLVFNKPEGQEINASKVAESLKKFNLLEEEAVSIFEANEGYSDYY